VVVFENMFSYGYVFVIIVAGLALITAYYKKKGYIKFQNPIKKVKQEGDTNED